jgi:hypothetical protein
MHKKISPAQWPGKYLIVLSLSTSTAKMPNAGETSGKQGDEARGTVILLLKSNCEKISLKT